MGRFSSHILVDFSPRPTCKDATAHDRFSGPCICVYRQMGEAVRPSAVRHGLECEMLTVSRMAMPMDMSAFGFVAPCIA